jgi:putative transposase
LAYIEAAQELISEGKMGRTRAQFVVHYDTIRGRGDAKQTENAKKAAGRSMAGFEYSTRSAPDAGETIFRWSKRYLADASSIFDRQNQSGNAKLRYNKDELDFAREIIATRLTEERPSIKNISDSVEAAFGVENRRRGALPVPAQPLRVPRYEKVWDLIAQIAPVDHAIRTRGMEVAYKDLHCIGLGLQITRPLERVELDVCDMDIMVFFDALGILGHLTQAELMNMGLDGRQGRIKISAAIDVFTGCMVGLQFATTDTADLALRTVEMIYLDKAPLSDAVGALCPWNMRGHPEVIAVDRGNAYISDDFYMRMAAAGITNLGVPAGKPFLKPWIERWFRTIGEKFVARFSGRTFSDIVKKGSNDPEARATLKLDEFLAWLVRWVVDVYHNEKPATLGRKAPRLAWEDAIRETPPYAAVDEDQLRIAFGIEKHCKLSRHGFRVGNLCYWAEELISAFLTEPWLKDRQFKIYWWSKQIGAITVELPDGRSIQAKCTDQKWHGKSYDDLLYYMRKAAKLDGLAVEARENAIAEMDAFSAKKMALARLMPHQPNAEELDHLQRKFSRFLDIPTRKLEGIIEIFGDEITPVLAAPDTRNLQAQTDHGLSAASASQGLWKDQKDNME